MTELAQSGLMLLVLLGSAALGQSVRPLLSERHWNRDTFDLVQLVTVMLVTFAALVLGLLTTSVKSSFDTASNDLRRIGSDLIQIDQRLREYGPQADNIRHLIATYTAAAIASTWPDEPAPSGDYPRNLPPGMTGTTLETVQLSRMLLRAEEELRGLQPDNAIKQRLASDSLTLFEELEQRRWKLIEEAQSSISRPFYAVLAFWLAVVFASFGLSAPRNLSSYAMIFLGAVSIASAVFVILDMDGPFGGWFAVSSEPLRSALAHLRA
jgi:hypothetical protein